MEYFFLLSLTPFAFLALCHDSSSSPHHNTPGVLQWPLHCSTCPQLVPASDPFSTLPPGSGLDFSSHNHFRHAVALLRDFCFLCLLSEGQIRSLVVKVLQVPADMSEVLSPYC